MRAQPSESAHFAWMLSTENAHTSHTLRPCPQNMTHGKNFGALKRPRTL
ncbi:unnamed protein product [Ixodes pacificus]